MHKRPPQRLLNAIATYKPLRLFRYAGRQNRELLYDQELKPSKIVLHFKIIKYAKAYKASSSPLKQPYKTIQRGIYKSPFFTSLSVDSPLTSKNFKYHRQWTLQGGSTSEILLRVTEEEKIPAQTGVGGIM